MKIFQIGVVIPELRFFKLANDANFYLHCHFRPNICGVDQNIKIVITIHPQREG